MTKESAHIVPPWLAIVAAWCAVISVWFAVVALCFIVPSYERENEPDLALQLAIWVSRVLRDSWHWIVVLVALVGGTLFFLGCTVRTARRARAAAQRALCDAGAVIQPGQR